MILQQRLLMEIPHFLNPLGLNKLSTIKSRQAYIMHNIEGKIVELIDDISIDVTLKVPNTIADTTIYFPREVYTFEPNINRYIAVSYTHLTLPTICSV